jgi:serine/threonine protein kinase
MSVKKRPMSLRKTRRHRENGVVRLSKGPRHGIYNMETYKVKCGQDLIVGLNNIKGAEETSLDNNDFVQISALKDYDKPVVVKIYSTFNEHLRNERRALEIVSGFRNTVPLLCSFACNDDKTRYITKLQQPIKFCNTRSPDKLNFFVFEYLRFGDISDYISKQSNSHVVYAIILQMVCVIMQLSHNYHILHGDLNTGNILVDITDEKMVDYEIDNKTISIASYGFIPKLIDYGKCLIFESPVPIYLTWKSIAMMFSAVRNYVKDEWMNRTLHMLCSDITVELPTLYNYYEFVESALKPRF